MTFSKYLQESADITLATSRTLSDATVQRAIDIILKAIQDGKPLLVCGNGGSSSDSMHIAGELVGKFMRERKALNCSSLSANSSILTAWSNDFNYETVFSRQVEGLGSAGGVLWGISTSGNSINIILALQKAKELGMATIGLTGSGGGRMANFCDVLLDVPSTSTPQIQEVHVCIYHYICQRIEEQI